MNSKFIFDFLDGISLFIFLFSSNKGILFNHKLIPSKNVSTEVYENAMASLSPNFTTAWEMENCSLSTQLDNVSDN